MKIPASSDPDKKYFYLKRSNFNGDFKLLENISATPGDPGVFFNILRSMSEYRYSAHKVKKQNGSYVTANDGDPNTNDSDFLRDGSAHILTPSEMETKIDGGATYHYLFNTKYPNQSYIKSIKYGEYILNFDRNQVAGKRGLFAIR